MVLQIGTRTADIARAQPVHSGLPAYGQWRIAAGGRAAIGDFSRPAGIAVDTAGNVYVADSSHQRVQKLGPDGRPAADWGAPGRFTEPNGVAVDSAGTVYVADSVGIHKLASDGSEFGAWKPSGDSGPMGLAVDPNGNLWVADHNALKVFEFSKAGQRLAQYGGSRELGSPDSIAIARDGTVYVADGLGSRVFKMSATGQVLATWRGAGNDSKPFKSPQAVAIDTDGNLLVADTENQRILKLSSQGQLLVDWESLPLLSFQGVTGLAVGPDGTIYASDVSQDLVSALGPDGQPIHVWGRKPQGAGQLDHPQSIAVDEQANIFVSDTGNKRIQRFATDGTVEPAWGSQNDVPVRFNSPAQITLDGADHLLVVDSLSFTVTELDPYGKLVRTLGGTGNLDERQSTLGKFFYPSGVATDSAGDVYVADSIDGRIERFAPDGSAAYVRKGVGGDASLFTTSSLAVGPDGTLYVATANDGLVQRLAPDGTAVPNWPSKEANDAVSLPMGVAVDPYGNLWVASAGSHRILAIAPDGRLIGAWGGHGTDAGQFNNPSGIWVDQSGTVYVADTGNNRVQALDPLVAHAYAGDPVSTNDGEYSSTHVDSNLLPSSGALIPFARTYRSFGTGSDALGPGWSHSFDVYLTHEGTGGPNDLRVRRPSGLFQEFSASEAGVFQAAFDAPESLEQNSDGTFTSTTPDGSVWRFNRGGQLTSVAYRRGHETTLTYDRNRLVGVGDADNPAQLRLSYDTCFPGRLCAVTDQADPPRVVQYRYDQQGRLSTVVDREENKTQFRYANTSQKLEAILDARGHTSITLAYDEQERVASELLARGELARFTYDLAGNGSGRTTFTSAPAGYALNFAPAVIDTYSASAIQAREWRTGPTDDTLVETYNRQTGARTCTWSGGATRPPDGFVQAPPPENDAPPVSLPGLRLGDACLGQPSPPIGGRAALTLVEAKLPGSTATQGLIEAQRHATDVVRDSLGRITSFTDATSSAPHYWRLRYDREDHPRFIDESIGAADAPSAATELQYDAVGNLVRVVESNGDVVDFNYDEEDALVQVQSAASGFSGQLSYDPQGNLTRVVLVEGDGDGTVALAVDYAYDGLHRLRRVTGYPSWPNTGDAAVVEFVYDEQGASHAYVPGGS